MPLDVAYPSTSLAPSPTTIAFASLLRDVSPLYYVMLQGGMTPEEKQAAIEPLINATGKTQWSTMMSSFPDAVRDNLVILNNSNAVLSCPFDVSDGVYNIVLRYVAPGSSCDSCFSQIDGGTLQTNMLTANASGAQKTISLFANLALTAGRHTVQIKYREPVGLIDLSVAPA